MRQRSLAPDASRSRADRSPELNTGAGDSAPHSSGIRDCQCRQLPISFPRTSFLTNVPVEIFAKVFQCALKGLRGARRKGAKGVTRRQKLCLKRELFEIARLATPFLHCVEDALRPGKAAPARRTPAARFLRKKVFEIPEHANRTGLIIQHDHGPGAHAAACFLNLSKIHGYGQALFGQELRGPPARKQTAEAKTIAHTSGVPFQNFSYRGAHR